MDGGKNLVQVVQNKFCNFFIFLIKPPFIGRLDFKEWPIATKKAANLFV